MGSPNRSRTADGLEGEVSSSEAFAFQKLSWRIERTAWLVMTVVVLAGLLGLFGGGPLSARELRDDGIVLRYDAVARLGAPTVLDVQLEPTSGDARLALGADYVASIELDGVWPTPERVESADGWTTLTFASRGEAPVHVRVWLSPTRPGLLDGRLRREGGAALGFRQLVYP
jgi:hypothetical protein